MPKQTKSQYEQATTFEGEQVLTKCRNELKAFLGIVGTRCMMSEKDSVYAVRDACQMLGAADMDLRSAQLQAEVERLSGELATNHAKLAKG